MKFLIDIEDHKATTLIAILEDLPYITIKPLNKYKAKVLEDVKEAVNEMNMVLSGKIATKDAHVLLNEL